MVTTTGRRVQDQPATAEALRAGALSVTQAAAVGDALTKEEFERHQQDAGRAPP